MTIDVQKNLKLRTFGLQYFEHCKKLYIGFSGFLFFFLFFVFTKAYMYIWASNTAAPKGFQHTWRSSRYSVSPQGHPFGWWLCLLSGNGILGRTVGITLRVKLVFAKSWSLQRFSGCLHPIVTKRRRENFYADRLFNRGTFSFRWWQFNQIPNSSTRERSSWSIRRSVHGVVRVLSDFFFRLPQAVLFDEVIVHCFCAFLSWGSGRRSKLQPAGRSFWNSRRSNGLSHSERYVKICWPWWYA